MSNQINISPELVRLAQRRVRSTGLPIGDELARLLVEEAIVQLDPELGWLLEADQGYSESDALAQALGVNDVCVNGLHIDVRAVDADGRVALNRALVGTSYLNSGTLAVLMHGAHAGRIVGYLSSQDWQEAERRLSDSNTVQASVQPDPGFKLAGLPTLIRGLSGSVSGAAVAGTEPELSELARFVANRAQVDLARQRQIVEALMANASLRERLSQVTALWSNGTLSRILSAGATWNSRVEQFVERVAPKFQRLSREEVKRLVLKIGETHGGQPLAPTFRKAALAALTKEEVLRRVKGVDLARVSQIVDRVLSGRPAVDAVKDFMKSKIAVDLAVTIKRGRKKVQGYLAATAEEIGMAFQQMALQPAYATHSKDPQAGVEAINEALAMLDAGELAEQVKDLESELAKS